MVWGEPNRDDRFQPNKENSRVGPRAYAPLLDAAYAALKRESPRNRVIGGMTWTNGAVKPAAFLRWMRLRTGGHRAWTGSATTRSRSDSPTSPTRRWPTIVTSATATPSAIALMAEHPQLLQRPIVERGDRAVLARPIERVLVLLDG